jgi:predicted RNase H-like HicB family nuclease
MIAAYVEAALGHASIERMEDGRFFGHIDELRGPWADGDTADECRRELRSVLEEWLVIALRDDEELPVLDGVNLNFGGRRWSAQPVVASSSAS